MSNPSSEVHRQILQQLLDHPELQRYFHEDQPGRKPLTIVRSEALPSDVALKKFGMPVRFLSKDEASAAGITAALEFGRIATEEGKAEVEFVYPAEGIRGAARLRQDSSARWTVESCRLIEQ
jgi:hypothetical protein